jgi:hypothetical protein
MNIGIKIKKGALNPFPQTPPGADAGGGGAHPARGLPPKIGEKYDFFGVKSWFWSITVYINIDLAFKIQFMVPSFSYVAKGYKLGVWMQDLVSKRDQSWVIGDAILHTYLQFWGPEAWTVMGPLRNQYNRVTSNKVQMAENVCVCVRRGADTLKMGHTVSPVPTATR